MRKNELENALSGNTFKFTTSKSTEIANIMRYVNVELKMDTSSLDYYYEIDVDSLLSSQMPLNDLEDLKNEGWYFSGDKKKIIKFIK